MDPATKATALAAAVATHTAIGLQLQRGVDRTITVRDAETAIRRTADKFSAWLDGTTRIRLVPGPVVDETTGQPAETHSQEEHTMQMNTGQKFTVTADTEDASGYDTPETIEWVLDNSDVAALVVSADTRSCEVISSAPGSAVLTATITSLDPPLSATLAVDVVPAGTATIELVPGDVVDE